MLTHLSIQGLAIIESLNIDFGRGFNVITGETGAGKSILIKALSLLLGAKASPDSVRKGFDHANVSGRFVIRIDHQATEVLASLGVVPEIDEHGLGVIIRRQITCKGRSSAWINDIPVTTASLKNLAEILIDVFGQHDNHRLLDVTFHTHYLDQFLETKELPGTIRLLWSSASETLLELRRFIDDLRSRGRDLDYLTFRLRELEEFSPQAAEFESARSLSERAKSSIQIASSLQKAVAVLEDEAGETLARRLREAARALALPKVHELEVLAQDAQKIAELLDDLSFGLGRASGAIEISEEDIDKAEERVAGYQSLFRKHGVGTVDELIEVWEKLRQQVVSLQDASGHVLVLLEQFSSRVQDLLAKTKILSQERLKAIQTICKRVETELADLAMIGAKFSVDLEPVAKSALALDVATFGEHASDLWSSVMEDWTGLSDHGAERAQFYLASNAGEPSLPLAKIASGGEVSRIMLALKKALVVGAETCVLVFDEIDAGISGRIADIVGQKIAELSGFCQIICISHLPQVAAYARTHYIVEKKQNGERTESSIRPLKDEERFEEIARLLSGDKVTAASLSHAKGLIVEAHSKTDKGTAKAKAKEKLPAIAAAKKRRSI